METWAGLCVATGGDTAAGWVDEEPEAALEPDDDPGDPEDPDDPEDPVAGLVAGVLGVAAFALCPGSA
ncbi:MAG TPA: hypothetical protein VHY77_03095, partial [Acidimicrobiales bacterium]|nr:hypothetical protein [Acidimicrobiales bacterium]